jgi:hypothetical protein
MDAWEVDSREEGDIRRDIRVFVAAVDLETVDTVLVGALLR